MLVIECLELLDLPQKGIVLGLVTQIELLLEPLNFQL